MNNYFIAGTDASVGKSYVLLSILRQLKEQGVNAAGFKPVACGDRTEARSMREVMGCPTLSLDLINPVYLRSVADPMMAAELERKEISTASIVQAYKELSSQYETVLVEGCYGWATPLAPGVTMADLAKELALPILLVVENRRGAAGLVAPILAAIRQAGLTCAGLVLNHPAEEWDTAAVTNKDLLERTSGLPVLASLINGDDVDPELIDSLA